VNANGEVIGVASLVNDVTDRKKAEEDLIERERSQAATIAQLSVPIIDLWEGIIALPIVGTIDEARAVRMTEALLEAVVQNSTRFAILDLTGAVATDGTIANHLGDMIRAARLVGSECLVSGLGPALARTLVELDVALSVRTFGSLRAALRHAIRAARNLRLCLFRKGHPHFASGTRGAVRACYAAMTPRFINRLLRRWFRRDLTVWYDSAYRLPLSGLDGPLGMEPRRADFVAWYLIDKGVVPARAIRTPSPIPYADLGRVHDASWLESLATPATLARIFASTAEEIQVDPVLLTVRLACGGTLAAAKWALEQRKAALNLLGGAAADA
jgi:anti-anti-sigma regulatory factor